MNVQAILIQAGIELARLALSEFTEHVTRKSFAQFLCRVSNGSLCPNLVDEEGGWKCQGGANPAVHLVLSSDVDDLVTVMHPSDLFEMAANFLDFIDGKELRYPSEVALTTVDEIGEFLEKELFRFGLLLRESNESDEAYDARIEKQNASARDLELAYYLRDNDWEVNLPRQGTLFS